MIECIKCKKDITEEIRQKKIHYRICQACRDEFFSPILYKGKTIGQTSFWKIRDNEYVKQADEEWKARAKKMHVPLQYAYVGIDVGVDNGKS